MEKETSHSADEEDYAEIRAMLSALRIEATPEAHFEERFIYEFHERLVREAVSRPARALLWEHLLHIVHNLGGRRLAWGMSSFGAGVLCMGLLAWQYGGSAKQAVATHVCALEKSAATLHPGAAQEVASTTVSRAVRKPYTERLMSPRMNEMPSLAGNEDADSSSFWLSPTVESRGFDLNVGFPGLLPNMGF